MIMAEVPLDMRCWCQPHETSAAPGCWCVPCWLQSTQQTSPAPCEDCCQLHSPLQHAEIVQKLLTVWCEDCCQLCSPLQHAKYSWMPRLPSVRWLLLAWSSSTICKTPVNSSIPELPTVWCDECCQLHNSLQHANYYEQNADSVMWRLLLAWHSFATCKIPILPIFGNQKFLTAWGLLSAS